MLTRDVQAILNQPNVNPDSTVYVQFIGENQLYSVSTIQLNETGVIVIAGLMPMSAIPKGSDR